MTTTWLSFVALTSSSSMFAPAFTASLNAYIVLDGNSSSPPWWAMFHGVDWRHGFVAAFAAGTAVTAARSSAAGRRKRVTLVMRASVREPPGATRCQDARMEIRRLQSFVAVARHRHFG